MVRIPEHPTNIEVMLMILSSGAQEVSGHDLEAPVAARKGKRERRLPARYIHDVQPAPPPAAFPTFAIANDQPVDFQFLEAQIALLSAPATIPLREASTSPFIVHESKLSNLGVKRRYLLPAGVSPRVHDPDQLTNNRNKKKVNTESTYGPFANRTAFLLAEWYWASANKSFTDFQNLISIFKAEDFSLDDAIKVDWRAAFKTLGANRSDLTGKDGSWISDDGWLTATVSIDIPLHNRMKQSGTTNFVVGDFRYRSIVSVIKEKLSNHADSQEFHYYPYRSTWRRTPDSPDSELYGELYMSRAFREVHERIQRQPPTYHNEGLERVVVALMLWSDGTQLTSFGGASLWPCYLFFGNESKHRWGKPSQQLGYHIAYFMKLPDRLNDYLKGINGGKLPTDALFTYCRRELFHKQWSFLLSPEFVEATKHGIILPCPDGKERCFFPWIFTYSADYPEKVLIAGLRNNGLSPCHRCLVQTDQMFKLGAPSDTERLDKERSLADQQKKVADAQALIRRGYAVDSKDVIEKELVPTSLVPLSTAFSTHLADVDFSILSALTVDILHEFDIGVWKRLYVHLIRLLDAFPSDISLAAELDCRYRAIPAFGRDTIRKFPMNVSQMKRKAARDFEDLLQASSPSLLCSIPAFELLLPGDHNGRLMSLLFVCAQWQALAKLKLHNDYTLSLLDYTTTQLGAQMRRFDKDTCMKVPTKELAKEAEARARKDVANGKTGSASRRPKALGIYTIKFHFLGDYTSTIRRLGTTDSYSTQTGELYHRDPKSWYPRTDRKNYEMQLSKIERRKARLARIRGEMEIASKTDAPTTAQEQPSEASPANSTPELSPDPHYIIGSNQNRSIGLNFFASEPVQPGGVDHYLLDFISILKKHLLLRLLDLLGRKSDAIPEDQCVHVVLQGNRIYSHKLLKINYTTYDVCRDQDVLHVDTPQCNVMMLNSQYGKDTWSSEHPYIYGRTLGVFHANVSYIGPLPDGMQQPGYQRIDFVWLQWYRFIGSTGEFSLDCVSLCPVSSGIALDFVNPADIVRCIHLIPQFSLGKEDDPSMESQLINNRNIWKAYFINRFADRDMFMRYQYGMSVGHAYMHTENFPPPHIPSIPHNFDHCEAFRSTTPSALSDSATTIPNNSNNANDIGGESSNQADERDGRQGRLEDTISGFSGENANKVVNAEIEGLEDDGELREHAEEEDLDYFDDLDDGEFLMHNDMYGGDEDDP